MMKNKIFPLILFFPAVAGLCGAFLRGEQIKEAYEVSGGFISGSSSFAYGLLILCALVFLIAIGAAFLFTKWIVLSKNDVPKVNVFFPFWISGAIVFAYAVMVLFTLFDSFSMINLILCIFSAYCAVSLFALGRYRMSERENTAYCVMSAVPVFWAAFMLILTFREKISDPVVWDYVFNIFSYLSILFSAYAIAAHTLGKDKRIITLIACFCSIFFFLIEIFSPFVSGGNISLNAAKIAELLPQLAFLILMPFVTIEIFRKRN